MKSKDDKRKYLVVFRDGRSTKLAWMTPAVAASIQQRGMKLHRFNVKRA